MKKSTLATIYAIFCALLLLAGLSLAFYFAWITGLGDGVEVLVSIVISLFLVPTLHELGHVVFAGACAMEIEYVKFFCFKLVRTSGKLRFSLASPFAPDETQTLPTRGGNMQKRAALYTLGGLIFEGVFTLLIAISAITLSCFQIYSFALWGLLPYAAYLFLMNAIPLEYPSGKTDALVYWGLKKGAPTEKNMLAAMEIQGRLYAGESFAEIDEKLYFSAPQLCEDEPLYAVMLDLQYRYYLEKNELEKAADRLNRLASAQAYLTEREVEKIAAELTYLHALNGDQARAQECSKLCEDYLREEEAVAKRALAAYCKAFGKEEAVAPLILQAERILQEARCKGEAKAERILLARLA
ncbi:MAG: hypothetical protein J6B56_04930 [Clostridia bacterium]|nr:hypothetical protein [Clostridia bacterium]